MFVLITKFFGASLNFAPRQVPHSHLHVPGLPVGNGCPAIQASSRLDQPTWQRSYHFSQHLSLRGRKQFFYWPVSIQAHWNLSS